MSTAQLNDIRVARASIAAPMQNAVISFAGMSISVLAVRAQHGGKTVTGYGFHSNGRYAQCAVLRERLIPRLLAANPAQYAAPDGGLDPLKLAQLAMQDEKPGGHGERAVAAGALDMALWDATAKLRDEPLWHTLATRFNNGNADKQVFVYPGGGYYYAPPGSEDSSSIRQLQAEMRGYLDAGYVTVKMKIGGAALDTDLQRAEAVATVAGGVHQVALDANGKYSLPQSRSNAAAFAQLGAFFWYEEPLEPLDYAAHADLAATCPLPLATGENLFSALDTQNLLRHAGLRPQRDFLQMDPALAYGVGEYLQMLSHAEAHGWSRRRFIPHGGHQFALNIAAGLQLGGAESYPLVFQPFGGFADTACLENGLIDLPDAPGLGIECRPTLHHTLQNLLEI